MLNLQVMPIEQSPRTLEAVPENHKLLVLTRWQFHIMHSNKFAHNKFLYTLAPGA